MRHSYLTASLAVILSMGCVAASQAQTSGNTSNVQSQQTTTTTTTTSSNAPVPMLAPTAATPLTGQVQTVNYDNKFLGIGFGKNISKTITIEPGMGQVSLDRIHWRNKVSLTLVNPSATPLQFETTQRWGRQVVTEVPPHSQQMLTFSHSRPFTHEVKFFVMQEPSSAIATNQDYVTQQVATMATLQQTATREAIDRQTAMIHQALDQQTNDLKNSQEEAIREAANQRQRTAYNQPYSRPARHTRIRGYW